MRLSPNKLTALALSAFVVMLSSCGVKSGGRPVPADIANSGNDNPNDQDQSGQDPSANNPNQDPADSAALLLQAGVRNYAQIYMTMAVLTGVSPNNAAVKAAYDAELSTGLPAGNDAQAFLGSHQVAVTKLAVEYCDALFEDTTLRTQVIPGFNFAVAAPAAFTPANKALVTKSLLDRFWGTGMADRPNTDSTQPALIALLDSILVGKSTTDVNVTKNVVKGVCTAVLSSAPVTMF